MKKISKTQKTKELLSCLKELRVKRIEKYGLCNNIIHTCGYLRSLKVLASLSKNWVFYSGNLNYPVPHPKYPNDSELAREMFVSCTDKYSGEYGRLRLDLLEFLIAEVEKRLKHKKPLDL